MGWTAIVTALLVAGSLSMVSSSANSNSNSLENKPYPSMASELHARTIPDFSSSSSSSSSSFQPRLWDFPNPAPGQSLFNTSLAFTVPLFTINSQALTGASRSLVQGSLFKYANDAAAAYGSSVGFPPAGSGPVTALAIPVLIAKIHILLFDLFSRPFLSGVNSLGARASDSIFSSGFSGVAENALTFVENSLDHLFTVDGGECIKKSVCEVHSNPIKYIALPLQLLFPSYPYSGTDDISKISKYQLAARYGKNENANCDAQYKGCAANPLDLVTSFARMITDFR